MEDLLAYDKDGLVITTHNTLWNGRKLGNGSGGASATHRDYEPGFIARRRNLWHVQVAVYNRGSGEMHYANMYSELSFEDATRRAEDINAAFNKVRTAWIELEKRQQQSEQDAARSLKRL